MKPATICETGWLCSRLLYWDVDGGGGGGERARPLEKRTLWYFCSLNSVRGPKCVLARALVCAENCFQGHWETNTIKVSFRKEIHVAIIQLKEKFRINLSYSPKPFTENNPNRYRSNSQPQLERTLDKNEMKKMRRKPPHYHNFINQCFKVNPVFHPHRASTALGLTPIPPPTPQYQPR